jgi:hypothetical protein
MSKYAAQAALWRHGHEKGGHIRTALRRAYRREVAKAMRTRKDDLRAMLAVTSRLLDYSSHASPAHRWFSRRLATLRLRCKPWAVLQRVIEFYALVDRQPHRFPNADSEHLGLAKAVLPMARRKYQDHQSRLYRKDWYLAAGRYLAKQLAPAAILFVRRNLATDSNNTNTETQHVP